MSYLKIDDIVNVVVSTAGAATPRDGFNIGLIVGKSTRIEVSERCRVYSGLEAMLDDGFAVTDPEYKAATLYFAADPAPSKVVIGVCGADESWVDAITACKAANNSWYAVYCAAADGLSTAEHQAVATYYGFSLLGRVISGVFFCKNRVFGTFWYAVANSRKFRNKKRRAETNQSFLKKRSENRHASMNFPSSARLFTPSLMKISESLLDTVLSDT